MPPQQGGSAEAFVLYLSKKLMRLGHGVTIMAIKYSRVDTDIEYVDGIKFVRSLP